MSNRVFVAVQFLVLSKHCFVERQASQPLALSAGGQLLTGPVDGFSAGACLLMPLLYQSPSLVRVSFINTLIGNFTFFELLLFIAKT